MNGCSKTQFHNTTEFLILFMLLLISQFTIAQQKQQLQSKKQYLLQEVDEAEKILLKKRKDKVGTEKVLYSINKKVLARQTLIKNLQYEAQKIESEISATNNNINRLNKNIKVLKEEYATMILSAYKNRNEFSYWYFLFSSSDFNSLIKRLQYLRQYTDYRENQYQLLKNSIAKLEEEKQEQEQQQQQQQKVIKQEVQQRKKLQKEKQEQDDLVAKIGKEAKGLQQKIEAKRKAAQKLETEIAAIIRREIEAAKSKTKGVKNVKPADYLAATPEAKALSNKFESNRGKLPWPVDKGYISKKYGKSKHPYLKYIETNNNGINIATNKNATVKTIFSGEVANVLFNPGFQAAIIIRHGKYFTVYGNIKEAVVKTGDKVSIGQKIGVVYTDDVENKTEVHLEIWNGSTKMNPAYWVAK